jgi:hypothetical protein
MTWLLRVRNWPPVATWFLARNVAHLGVSHIREQLLLSFLEFFCRVIAIHGKQMMAKPVHPGSGSTGTSAPHYPVSPPLKPLGQKGTHFC